MVERGKKKKLKNCQTGQATRRGAANNKQTIKKGIKDELINVFSIGLVTLYLSVLTK